jgi:hypothetical protein
VRASFSIFGEGLNPADCTLALGLEPTTAERKGDSRPNGRPVVRESRWAVETDRRRVYTVNEPLVELLDKLWPCRHKIVRLLEKPQVSAIFSVSVTIHDERPEYCFPPATLQRLAEIGAELCLDIYDYSD